MKRIQDFTITGKRWVGGNVLLELTAVGDVFCLDDIRPGQFVQVKADCAGVTLRRPISVCDVVGRSTLVLMVKPVGGATRWMATLGEGDRLNLILPLGNGFDTERPESHRTLLVGGGVGIAPMVMLARKLAEAGKDVTVVLGGRSAADLDGVDTLFDSRAKLYFTTNDGSRGTAGFVVDSEAFDEAYDIIYSCGPTPMMKAVASVARGRGVECQVSLENMMGCGIGACLCCVEKTVEGNLCVCTDGPVFNINQLLWK